MGYLIPDGRILLLVLSSASVICLGVHAIMFKQKYDESLNIPECSVSNSAGLYNYYMQNVYNQNTGNTMGEKVSTHYLLCGAEKCVLNGTGD